MDSIWQQTAKLPRFSSLEGDRSTQVLIIGGGIAGLLCAHRLTRAGADCLLVEQGEVCGGVTQNTTAKVTLQHGLIYHKLIRRFGLNAARLYLQANQLALEEYRALCRQIPCDYEEQDSIVYARSNSPPLLRELDALERLGCPAHLDTRLPLPFPTVGGVRVPRQGQLHPLKLAAGLAKGLPIHTHTRVLELAPGRAITSGGVVRADHIIVATHFPMLNKHGSYFLKQYQHRSYVLALKGAPAPDGMFVDEAMDGLSFRSWGQLLLLGGGSHRTGKPGGGWQELERVARRYYPAASVAARWATQDCMTLDDMPYIGPYSPGTPGLYVTTGFNKWGMTSAMAAASSRVASGLASSQRDMATTTAH